MRRTDIKRGFLTRLAHDKRGNTIALMAAAMVPLAGLIGGGVDMSRLYLTKTRVQQACDAGVLAGRKAMGAGSWTTGTNSTQDKAEKMFGANFAAGNYGTGTLTKDFTESNGIVSGTASVAVPMTIMKVFGMGSRQISVECTAKMELPNTDVMFVLDVTRSMQCLPSATSDGCSAGAVGSRRIDGLKRAVKCFYEALVRVNTPEVCTASDPTATTSTTTAQVRIGFVPYGVNVNVGRSLPHGAVADNWTYQTRVANLRDVWSWTLGTESNITGFGIQPLPPTDLVSQNTYSGWSNVSGSGSVTVNGLPYTKQPSNMTSSTCAALNVLGPSGNKMVAYQDVEGATTNRLVGTTNNPPVHPAASQTLSYAQDETHVVTGYKYVWSNSRCRLQSATRDYTLTRTGGTSTKNITWTQHTGVFRDWDYKPASLNVSDYKSGASNWNSSITLPIGLSNGPTVNLSGSNSSVTLQNVANVSVDWDGCIEEAQTFQNTDGNPSDDWSPVPSNAFDMNINLVPSASTAGTQWGPMIEGAVWARYSGGTSSYSFNPILNSTTNMVQNNYNYICTTTPAKKLTEYKTNTDFLTYVNSLNATDMGTYHDIGMLWGARFLSPTGIFASENAFAATGGAIQRHMIFMTDGGTYTIKNNYNAYGLSFFNRKQSSFDPSETFTNDLVNARLLAICDQVKNMNITLWVISYGSGVNATTQDRLRQCATPPNSVHFVSAADTATLTAQFQQIAAKISELRLTS
jgi:Flp pilus assembly protein TadG